MHKVNPPALCCTEEASSSVWLERDTSRVRGRENPSALTRFCCKIELEANEILPLKSTELFLAYHLPPILRASNLPPDFVKHPDSRKTPTNSPGNQSRW